MGIAAVWVFAVLALAAPASAATPEFLLQIPAESVLPGQDAGKLNNPRGMAADPATGHLFVGDRNNARIDEFTAWGTFVKAWGWDVAPEKAPGDTASDQFEICTTICKVGVESNGVGQLNRPKGVAIDVNGSIYVHESSESSRRVQKFSPSGQFLLMFGGEVNKTTGANVCTKTDLESGQECGTGVFGTADGFFSSGSVVNYLTYNPKTNTIFVGDVDRIQEFNLDGTFKGKIDFEGALGAFDGKAVNALAADPSSGDLYVVVNGLEGVYRLSSGGTLLGSPLKAKVPVGLAVDVAGNVYVVEDSHPTTPVPKVLGYDAAGAPIEGMEAGDGFAEALQEVPNVAHSRPSINGLATSPLGPKAPASGEPGNLYVDYFRSGLRSEIRVFGPPPIPFEDPPSVPPAIKSQYAVSVDTDAATLRAQINPQFWPDTTYYVEYGTASCSEGGCQAHPATPGALLTSKSTNALLTSAGVFLADLQPDTTYHYRFLAQSSGGSTIGTEGAFRTFPLPDPPETDCPNQALRGGASANLPDCRAYEMVSPLDKANSDIVTLNTFSGYSSALEQSSLSGETLTYSSGTAFGSAESTPFVSQYLAHRDPGLGWLGEALAPPRTRAVSDTVFSDNEFKAFSEDLCQAWLRTEFDPPLAPGAVPGYRNLYRRENCNEGFYEALSTAPPPHVPPQVTNSYEELQFQGASADGTHAIFIAPDNLTEDATPPPSTCVEEDNCPSRLYETADGQLRFVCILPNGSPTTQPCYAGTATFVVVQGGAEREDSLDNAISADGERIFWTQSPVDGEGPGRIYLRIGGTQTTAVSQSVSGDNARFWGAANDGSRAIFSFEQDKALFDGSLYSFDTDKALAEEPEASTLIAKDLKGVLGLSEDARRVYFASSEAIAGAGANNEGAEAVAGKSNLYLWEEGKGEAEDSYIFLGALADDEGSEGTSPVSLSPYLRLSRVSPDGMHAIFMSTAPLTGYDNIDAFSGKPNMEVFLYDAVEDELRCVSCNPSGARPTGVDRATIKGTKSSSIWQAAQIPTWNRPFYASRALSEDGSRLFFESWEALDPRDTNGVRDVYQWEEAGTGGCDEEDATFGEDAEGCIELISSGKSPRESVFMDADPTGDDVFFATLSSLVPADYGLVDVYDARVGGGFPEPSGIAGCEGEACQGPISAPDDPTPASSSFQGAGNVTEGKPTPCRKGKVRRRGRCVRKPRRAKRQHRAKRASSERRAQR